MYIPETPWPRDDVPTGVIDGKNSAVFEPPTTPRASAVTEADFARAVSETAESRSGPARSARSW